MASANIREVDPNEPEEDDHDTDDEESEDEEDDASFIEWLGDKVENSKQLAALKRAGGKAVSVGKVVGSWTGSLLWVLGSTAVIVAFPLALGINQERQLIEMQKSMASQGQGGGAGGFAPM
mmetsp:Transcript_14927/g.21084  ORF Transcript_14927/g.21084 Transcript_14927/m.21084 type:complete len:121 (-) Transcript_14927:275-637(-)|eukprot:CAMPEP_0175104244 /NCGR_PEP_ID=MMETSP0086_2-20121207/9603_1 /TAXON_ID=136419 /ORGANISM="Unknown Unknown, Strain D1" /LENGTH=120 /DNA_ID=CAMNT_0016379581 /DNA_START=25 /DNA_END=387 /DNA_ORIENTATION=-